MIQLNDIRLANRVVARFTELFGDPLDLWVFESDHWHHVVDVLQATASVELLESAVILPESLPRDFNTTKLPIVEEIDCQLFRIAAEISIPSEGHPTPSTKVVVAGSVKTTSALLVSSMLRLDTERLRLAREVEEHQLGVMPHLEQISHDFEELTWLRRLSEQVDFCNVCDPLVDLAQGILPDLRSLIQAECVVLVGKSTIKEGASSESTRASHPLFWAGERLLDNDVCANFVEELRKESQIGRPLVLNRLNLSSNFSIPPAIHSCIQIALTHQGACYGWLLAFNRNLNQPTSDLPNQRQAGLLGHEEFGTSEASLMSSAASTLAAHARSAELFREREFLLIGIIRALISAIDAKDVYTCGHSDRVALTGRCIAEQLGLEPIECERLYMAGLLHDVGKIGVPDRVLLKSEKLTDEEYEIIKRHPAIGHSILNHMPQLRQVLPGVLHHHEEVDGRGYPHGLKGEAIPLFGRILAVADAFDAMTSDRPYRKGMPVSKAVAILKDGVGKQWDAQVVQAFLDVLPKVEAATQNSSQHVKELLQQAEHSNADSGVEAESDAIMRAVALAHS